MVIADIDEAAGGELATEIGDATRFQRLDVTGAEFRIDGGSTI